MMNQHLVEVLKAISHKITQTHIHTELVQSVSGDRPSYEHPCTVRLVEMNRRQVDRPNTAEWHEELRWSGSQCNMSTGPTYKTPAGVHSHTHTYTQ